jgi:phosphoglycolate phosphatase-like HAD superfamily hydrolase
VTGLRAIILDFDGVIVESNAVKTAAFADVFTRFPEHFDRMMAFHHANVSLSRFAKFDYLLRECLGRPEDVRLRDELAADFSRSTTSRVVACPAVAGADAFLQEFAPKVALYLASVTPQADLDEIVSRRRLRPFFREVYGCPPWTKEGAIRDVLRREDIAPALAVLVGDSEGDRRAADSTGVHFVARDSGLPFDAPPASIHADLRAIADYLRPRLH